MMKRLTALLLSLMLLCIISSSAMAESEEDNFICVVDQIENHEVFMPLIESMMNAAEPASVCGLEESGLDLAEMMYLYINEACGITLSMIYKYTPEQEIRSVMALVDDEGQYSFRPIESYPDEDGNVSAFFEQEDIDAIEAAAESAITIWIVRP